MEKDWAAIALGLNGQKIKTQNYTGDNLLALERNTLAKSAQSLECRQGAKRIEDFYKNGQLGDERLINDDIFGMLAIMACDKQWFINRPEIWINLAAGQKSDGSFGYSKKGNGDSDMTAAALWVLKNGNNGENQVRQALAYLKKSKNIDGGYGLVPGAPSNAYTTAWVLKAKKIWGQRDDSAERFLKRRIEEGKPDFLFFSYALMALSDGWFDIKTVNFQESEKGKQDKLPAGDAIKSEKRALEPQKIPPREIGVSNRKLYIAR